MQLYLTLRQLTLLISISEVETPYNFCPSRFSQVRSEFDAHQKRYLDTLEEIWTGMCVEIWDLKKMQI